uniref:AB hydrolase-1 domain-containing protein n=1 Tax=Zooxanthella nutricula TaxID=1333877 RepID=A0A6U6JAD9_9DINO
MATQCWESSERSVGRWPKEEGEDNRMFKTLLLQDSTQVPSISMGDQKDVPSEQLLPTHRQAHVGGAVHGEAPTPYWTQPTQCCCCSVPRWTILPLILAIVYVAGMPIVYILGHFLFYPGDDYRTVAEGCEEFSFSVGDHTVPGLRCGWPTLPSVQAQVRSKSVRPVVVIGGNGMDMYDSAAVMRKAFPIGDTWQVYAMSMPGFQFQPRREWWTRPDVALEDAHALLDYALRETGRDSAVVYGWSLGSSVATGLAASSPGKTQCLMLGNPFTTMRAAAMAMTFNLVAPWLYLLDDWPTERWAREVHSPTIVMSSLQDNIVPVHMHTDVFKSIPAKPKVLLERQAEHMDMEAFMTASAVNAVCRAPQ